MMKSFFLFVLVLFCMLFCVSCGMNNNSNDVSDTENKLDNTNNYGEINILKSMWCEWVGYTDVGFNINDEQLPSNEQALVILSQDTTHDIYLIESEDPFAYNIRDKGAFYPLNDVPYVREYIDACFPFVQDAATDDNGNICMIPVYVGVDFFMVNTTNASKADIDMCLASTPTDVIKYVEEAYNYQSGSYVIHLFRFIQKSLLQYLRENNSFDTPEFRAFAEELKAVVTLDDSVYGDANYADPLYNDELLFYHHQMMTLTNIGLERFYSNDADIYDVVPITGSSGSPSAYAEFLCINPYSDNIDTAREFVSFIAQQKLNESNSFLLADIKTYSDVQFVQSLYTVFESATIDFNIPYEILHYLFIDYLNGMMSIDDMISEADRLLNMYRYE